MSKTIDKLCLEMKLMNGMFLKYFKMQLCPLSLSFESLNSNLFLFTYKQKNRLQTQNPFFEETMREPLYLLQDMLLNS